MIVPNKFLRLEETPLGKIKFIMAMKPQDGEIYSSVYECHLTL